MALNLPPDEIPTAHAVALAVVAAAKVTGDHPLDIGDKHRVVRARIPAVLALNVYYGQVQMSRLGRYVGIDANIHQKVLSAEKAAWWAGDGVREFEAACMALETI